MQVTRNKKGFQFTQLNSDFEPRIAKLFAQGQGTKIKLNLIEVILLDCQSTTDLFGNANMLEQVYKSKSTLNLKSNGGNLKTRQKGKITGYHTDVWYSKSAIANILSLGNMIKQYRVTYDSNNLMFVVHRGVNGKPDMHFCMHECGLHYYDPREHGEQRAFVETVEESKRGLTQRQIKGAKLARSLYNTLAYPSWKDFQWVVRSNMIKNCPVTLEDINAAQEI